MVTGHQSLITDHLASAVCSTSELIEWAEQATEPPRLALAIHSLPEMSATSRRQWLYQLTKMGVAWLLVVTNTSVNGQDVHHSHLLTHILHPHPSLFTLTSPAALTHTLTVHPQLILYHHPAPCTLHPHPQTSPGHPPLSHSQALHGEEASVQLYADDGSPLNRELADAGFGLRRAAPKFVHSMRTGSSPPAHLLPHADCTYCLFEARGSPRIGQVNSRQVSGIEARGSMGSGGDGERGNGGVFCPLLQSSPPPPVQPAPAAESPFCRLALVLNLAVRTDRREWMQLTALQPLRSIGVDVCSPPRQSIATTDQAPLASGR